MLRPMDWFYLALLVPVIYAVINLIDDNLLQFVYKNPFLATAATGFFGAVPLISAFFIDSHPLPIKLAMLSAAAGFLTIAYYFFYFKGLASDTPSVVVALFGLAPATIPFFAYFIVDEQLSALQILGFIIVLSGSLGLAVTDVRRFKFSKALFYMAIAVIFMDIVSIMTKYVYQRVDFYSAYLYFLVGMATAGLIFLLLNLAQNKQVLRELASSKSIKRLLPIIVFVELLGMSAEFLLNFAISRGPVSLVKVIEGSQPMFVLLIALILYRFWPKYFREAEEGNLARKFAMMIIIVIGLGVIAQAAAA